MTPYPAPPSPLAIALNGALCLATLMGVGRFAYTPVLPLMLADGSLDLAAASALASLNYLGYLVGALACAMGLARWLQVRLERPDPDPGDARPPRPRPRAEVFVLGFMLLATAVLTAGMALPWAGGWPAWRLASGMVSAVGFVYATQWCLTRLALQGRTALGGLMYTGPGLGIAGSGLLAGAMGVLGWPAWSAWLMFAALALGMAAVVWRTLGRDQRHRHARGAPAAGASPSGGDAHATAPAGEEPPGAARAADTASAGRASTPPGLAGDHLALWGLTAAYGLAGFGYIIPATFLPVMARAWLGGAGGTADASGWEAGALADLFWPLFGLGIVMGATLASRVRESLDLRKALLVCYLVQALGVALAAWRPDIVGLALGSLLLGLPFTAITFFAMREVRRLRPHSATRWIGLTTASYGIGQIVGPPVAAWLVARAGQEATGFTVSMHLATATLLTGAGIFAWLLRSARAR